MIPTSSPPRNANTLNSLANIPGAFTYTPAAGTVLSAGNN